MGNTDLELALINSSAETFTPTHSGAICTVIHEVSLQAMQAGCQVRVLSRPAPVESYNDVPVTFVPAPDIPAGSFAELAMRAERKIFGYRHFRHGEYIRRTISAIRGNHLTEFVKLTSNDPELAIGLKRAFPRHPVVLWFHNQLGCRGRFRRKLASSGVRCIAVSNFTARWIEGYYGLPANSVPTVYNAVDLHHFFPASESPPGTPVVNFLGRSCPEKGPDLLLKAALGLAKKGLKFRLQLIGSTHWGHYKPNPFETGLDELVRAVESRGILVYRPGHVGRRPLPDELRRAHIHVFASRWDEPFGMATLEGMACGLATVASNTGGTLEVVGDASLLFERENVEQLSEHLERLVADENLRRDYAIRARQRALNFTWAKTWAALRDAINARAAAGRKEGGGD